MRRHSQIWIAAACLLLTGASGASPGSGDPPPPVAVVATFESEPVAAIDGPDEAAPGDLIILDASASHGSDRAWLLVSSEKRCLPVDDGLRCVFATGTPGSYTFVLAVACEGRVATATHTVLVQSPSPPGPTPGPPAPPGPDLPPGKFNLAKLARDWANSVRAETPSLRTQAARSLAGSFRSVASAIAAGTLTDPASILAETRSGNAAALGGQVEDWRDWAKKMAEKLRDLHESGALRTLEDFATAWLEIALGLEAVR